MTTIQLIQIYIELWSAVLCAVFAVSLFIIRKEEPFKPVAKVVKKKKK